MLSSATQARGGSWNDDMQRWMDLHDKVLCGLLRDMVRYLPKVSARLPVLPPGWEPEREVLLQPAVWEEVRPLRVCSSP